MVASVDSFFHEAAPVLAPPHRVLVFQLGRRAAHFTLKSEWNPGGAWMFTWWRVDVMKWGC